MKQILSRAMAVVTVAVGLTAAASVPAEATTGPDGTFVMWQHDSYQGQQESRLKYDNNLHNDACSGCDPGPGGDFGDDMSSFVNNTDYWWAIYIDRRDQPGSAYDDVWCVRPRSRDADLGNNGFGNLEDEISSIVRLDKDQHRIIRCYDDGHEIGHK